MSKNKIMKHHQPPKPRQQQQRRPTWHFEEEWKDDDEVLVLTSYEEDDEEEEHDGDGDGDDDGASTSPEQLKTVASELSHILRTRGSNGVRALREGGRATVTHALAAGSSTRRGIRSGVSTFKRGMSSSSISISSAQPRNVDAENSTSTMVLQKKKRQQPSPLPNGWKSIMDPNSGKIYYYHVKSGKTSWEMPTSSAANNNSFQDNDRVCDDQGGGANINNNHQQQQSTTTKQRAAHLRKSAAAALLAKEEELINLSLESIRRIRSQAKHTLEKQQVSDAVRSFQARAHQLIAKEVHNLPRTIKSSNRQEEGSSDEQQLKKKYQARLNKVVSFHNKCHPSAKNSSTGSLMRRGMALSSPTSTLPNRLARNYLGKLSIRSDSGSINRDIKKESSMLEEGSQHDASTLSSHDIFMTANGTTNASYLTKKKKKKGPSRKLLWPPKLQKDSSTTDSPTGVADTETMFSFPDDIMNNNTTKNSNNCNKLKNVMDELSYTISSSSLSSTGQSLLSSSFNLDHWQAMISDKEEVEEEEDTPVVAAVRLVNDVINYQDVREVTTSNVELELVENESPRCFDHLEFIDGNNNKDETSSPKIEFTSNVAESELDATINCTSNETKKNVDQLFSKVEKILDSSTHRTKRDSLTLDEAIQLLDLIMNHRVSSLPRNTVEENDNLSSSDKIKVNLLDEYDEDEDYGEDEDETWDDSADAAIAPSRNPAADATTASSEDNPSVQIKQQDLGCTGNGCGTAGGCTSIIDVFGHALNEFVYNDDESSIDYDDYIEDYGSMEDEYSSSSSIDYEERRRRRKRYVNKKKYRNSPSSRRDIHHGKHSNKARTSQQQHHRNKRLDNRGNYKIRDLRSRFSSSAVPERADNRDHDAIDSQQQQRMRSRSYLVSFGPDTIVKELNDME